MKTFFRRSSLLCILTPMVLVVAIGVLLIEIITTLFVMPGDIYEYVKCMWVKAKYEDWNPFDYK